MGVAGGAEEAELQLPAPVPAEPRPVQRPAGGGGTRGQAAPHIRLQPQVGGGPKIYLVSEEKYLIANCCCGQREPGAGAGHRGAAREHVRDPQIGKYRD